MVFPQLKQKIVLVIGGAQGIGAAVRRTFLTESAVVIDADRQYKDTFSQTSLMLTNVFSIFVKKHPF